MRPRSRSRTRRRARRSSCRTRARSAVLLPVGANIIVQDGDIIEAGESSRRCLARRRRRRTSPAVSRASRSCSKPASRRTTRSSPRSTARSPSARTRREAQGPRHAAHDGQARGSGTRVPDPKGKHIQVQPGDCVSAGEPLMDGPANPHESACKGREGARGLARERDPAGLPAPGRRHQRQAHRGDRASDAPPRPRQGRGRYSLLVDEQVEKHSSKKRTKRVLERGGSRASRNRCSSASRRRSCRRSRSSRRLRFQETTKVLTEAAICGKTDDLRGLKENVIWGASSRPGRGSRPTELLATIVETDEEWRYTHPAREPVDGGSERRVVLGTTARAR